MLFSYTMAPVMSGKMGIIGPKPNGIRPSKVELCLPDLRSYMVTLVPGASGSMRGSVAMVCAVREAVAEVALPAVVKGTKGITVPVV